MLSLLSTGLRVKAGIAATAALAAAVIILNGGPAAVDLTAQASTAVDGAAPASTASPMQWTGISGQAVLDTPAARDIGPLQGDRPETVGPVVPGTPWNGPAATVLAAIQANGLLASSTPVPGPQQPIQVTLVLAPVAPGPTALTEAQPLVGIVSSDDGGTAELSALPAVNSYPLTARASGS